MRHEDLLVRGDGNPHITREIPVASNRHQPLSQVHLDLRRDDAEPPEGSSASALLA
ncbi:MAG: hypothetical protein GY788_23445 [bacterium]|nr:hypothetical protein [bacterium]